jgi:hypothetical protein
MEWIKYIVFRCCCVLPRPCFAAVFPRWRACAVGGHVNQSHGPSWGSFYPSSDDQRVNHTDLTPHLNSGQFWRVILASSTWHPADPLSSMLGKHSTTELYPQTRSIYWDFFKAQPLSSPIPLLSPPSLAVSGLMHRALPHKPAGWHSLGSISLGKQTCDTCWSLWQFRI